MKYELIGTPAIHGDVTIDEETYSNKITLAFHPVDNIAPDFSRDIEVVSSNSQTGYEVDIQRQEAIDAYVIQINS
jgi:hypothetical protein